MLVVSIGLPLLLVAGATHFPGATRVALHLADHALRVIT
jgi:hypothetical protein